MADVARNRAVRAEGAAGRRGARAEDVSGQNDSPTRRIGVRVWDRRQQRLGTGMMRCREDAILRSDLHHAPEIHHHHSVGDVSHHREVVRDEEAREPAALLQVLEQVDDVRLDRDVERRDRFVGDDQAGLERDGARDADAAR